MAIVAPRRRPRASSMIGRRRQPAKACTTRGEGSSIASAAARVARFAMNPERSQRPARPGSAGSSMMAPTVSVRHVGIKAGSGWNGATVNVPTLEFEDGVAVRKVDRFRSYSSPADSFRDYAGLIRNSPRYADAVGSGGNIASFASALQEGGYATDPAYADKIVRVANEIRTLVGSADLKSGAAAPISVTEFRHG